MRLFSIMLLKWQGEQNESVKLAEAVDVSNTVWFKRSTVKDVLTFVSRNVVSRSHALERSSVFHQEYMAHVCVTADKLACVVITDAEYPCRVAFDISRQAIDALHATQIDIQPVVKDAALAVPVLDTLLQRYQKPAEVDKLVKIRADLDATQDIMRKNLDDLLACGERLDDIVAKSNDLRDHSKTFVINSKKLNSCC